MANSRNVAVIGAGWAGCAAAVEMAERGWQVDLFESSRTLGGRARQVEAHGHKLDNGQHILLGAYTASLKMMRKVGVDLDLALLRLPLQMCYSEHEDGMQFVAPKWPAPLHLLLALLRAKGLNNDDKLALARFSTTARWMDWQLHTDCSVSELLQRFDQTQRLCDLMWVPLCIAALNTPPERASAQVFLHVLRDSLGAKRAASDMLIPRSDLSTLFPLPAANYVQQRGGNVHLGAAVKSVSRDADNTWQVTLSQHGETQQRHYQTVVVACPAEQAATWLPDHIPAFEYEPITTCYLQFDPSVTLPRPFFALRDQPELGHWGQFVFDRGQLDSAQAGLLAVVVSAASHALQLEKETLVQAICWQLAKVFNDDRLRSPHWQQVISEKRATFACRPGLQRPSNQTAFDNLVIAGDYTESDYPATIEAAVRSGISAANILNQNRKRNR